MRSIRCVVGEGEALFYGLSLPRLHQYLAWCVSYSCCAYMYCFITCMKNVKKSGEGTKKIEFELFLPFCPSPAIPSNKYKNAYSLNQKDWERLHDVDIYPLETCTGRIAICDIFDVSRYNNFKVMRNKFSNFWILIFVPRI